MDITLLLIGLSFLLLWLFKQRRKTTQIAYSIVGISFMITFLIINFLSK